MRERVGQLGMLQQNPQVLEAPAPRAHITMNRPLAPRPLLAALAAPVAASLFLSASARGAGDEAGWQTLFNGHDLAGWRANVMPESFSVVDGAIRARATRESSHLFYVGDQKEGFVKWKNFELEATVKSEPGSNSGIFFHTDFSLSNAQSHLAKGYKVQFNSTAREKRKTGSLYAIVDRDRSPVDESQWFTIRIKVQQKHIQIWLRQDGQEQQTVDYTEPSDAAAKRPPDRKRRLLDPEGGAIALQGHDPGSTFYFKDIRIRRLP